MSRAQIFDKYPSHVAHIRIGNRILHACVAEDAKSAECLETRDRVAGKTREDCLRLLTAVLLERTGAEQKPQLGIIG